MYDNAPVNVNSQALPQSSQDVCAAQVAVLQATHVRGDRAQAASPRSAVAFKGLHHPIGDKAMGQLMPDASPDTCNLCHYLFVIRHGRQQHQSELHASVRQIVRSGPSSGCRNLVQADIEHGWRRVVACNSIMRKPHHQRIPAHTYRALIAQAGNTFLLDVAADILIISGTHRSSQRSESDGLTPCWLSTNGDASNQSPLATSFQIM